MTFHLHFADLEQKHPELFITSLLCVMVMLGSYRYLLQSIFVETGAVLIENIQYAKY